VHFFGNPARARISAATRAIIVLPGPQGRQGSSRRTSTFPPQWLGIGEFNTILEKRHSVGVQSAAAMAQKKGPDDAGAK